MIRKTLIVAATTLVLGAGFVGLGGVAAPSSAQAQWRDYDRPSYGQRRHYRERAYRPQRPAYGRGYNVPAGPNGLGRAGFCRTGVNSTHRRARSSPAGRLTRPRPGDKAHSQEIRLGRFN
ncbi:hypothetical protein [Bosea sp. 685]|uniref:hypothetical protein n=1 Tax=Bosea sp. 685 TaxID=3080057 RepID=UPI002892980C|nr:hypothetical protein [Bosea sp. 685]WNJ88951.1 hypothetical protein RMR04_21390 [Bosea sp. 685]